VFRPLLVSIHPLLRPRKKIKFMKSVWDLDMNRRVVIKNRLLLNRSRKSKQKLRLEITKRSYLSEV